MKVQAPCNEDTDTATEAHTWIHTYAQPQTHAHTKQKRALHCQMKNSCSDSCVRAFLPGGADGCCGGGHGWQYALEAADGCWWGVRACTPHPYPPQPPLPGCCCSAAPPLRVRETAYCSRAVLCLPHQPCFAVYGAAGGRPADADCALQHIGVAVRWRFKERGWGMGRGGKGGSGGRGCHHCPLLLSL